MESSGKREGVKIVQIETRYVQTDAMNFRDVVQSLTGKNSSTAWVGDGSKKLPLAASLKSDDEFQFHDHGSRDDDRSSKRDDSLSSKTLSKNTTTSFKDFDRLLYEFPRTEDLPWL
ncbi:VQ motif-containing protein 1-like, partial [Prosopis cineraria]|uniref:VQ motif-containing protein 1-like n=1 Tax=Prosopis cineraria TaxID=364024 RepID=UPI00240EFB29